MIVQALSSQPQGWLGAIAQYKDLVQTIAGLLGLAALTFTGLQLKNNTDQRSLGEVLNFERIIHPELNATASAAKSGDESDFIYRANSTINIMESILEYVVRGRMDKNACYNISYSSIHALMFLSMLPQFHPTAPLIVRSASYTAIREFLVRSFRRMTAEQVKTLYPIFFDEKAEELSAPGNGRARKLAAQKLRKKRDFS